MNWPVYYIVLLLTIVVMLMVLQCVQYGTTRALFSTSRVGKRVSAFCDTIRADDRSLLVDPVLTIDGYFIGDLVCGEPSTPKKRIKDLFVTTFLTDCPTVPDYQVELNRLRDWIRVKCASVQDPLAYAQTLNERIRTVPGKPRSVTMFYRDRMDPRKYAVVNRRNIQMNRDIVRIDPLDDSWFFAVNSDDDNDFTVFENVRSLVFRAARNYTQTDLGGITNSSAFVGRFCVANSTLAVEVRAIRTQYRLFKVVNTSLVPPIPSETRNCCVCLDSINRTSPGVSTLSCGHYDHEYCLNEWFGESFTCPECRADDISVVY